MHQLKATFTRGESSPLTHARQDIELYQSTAEKIFNWHVLREGGIRRRSGTKYRGATKTTGATKFLDFIYSASQAYALEFGDEYVRFWTGGGQILDGPDIYEIVSPYPSDELENLVWAQANDVMYITTRDRYPRKLKRLGLTNWQFAFAPFVDGPYLPINDAANMVVSNAALDTVGATVRFTFESTANINGGNGFVSTDADRHFRIQFDGKWSWGTISTVVSDKIIDVVMVTANGGGGNEGVGGTGELGGFNSGLEGDTTGTTAGSGNTNDKQSYSWRLGAFSDTTGYPRNVIFFQGRTIYASTPANPKLVAYSYSGAPDVFTPSLPDGTVTDAHGGVFDITASDEILWLKEAARIQIGTPRAIRSLGASDIEQVFGPRNVTQKLEIDEGVSSVRPVTVGPSSVHAGQLGESIHDLYYDYNANSLINPELSTTAEHMFSAGVKELWFQKAPYRRLWSLLDDGTLTSTTVDRYEKVIGFARHDVEGTVVSMCSIPGALQHDLYLVVNREIDGEEVQYVETMQPDFLRNDIEDAFFVDCGGTYSGAATNTVTGATWLANTEVDILADGVPLPRVTIDEDGAFELPGGREAEIISFGIPIDASGRTLRAPIQTQQGSALGRRTRVVGVDVDLYETKARSLKLVSDMGQVDTVRERPASKKQANGALQTGTHRTNIDGSWTSEGQFEWRMDVPLPATIRAFNIHLDTE